MEHSVRKFKTPLISQGFIQKLSAAGLVPENTQRIIIDIPCDGIVQMHYTTFTGEAHEGMLWDVITDIFKAKGGD